MSSIPGVRETLALLERLRTTVRDFAREEAALEQVWQSRSTAEKKAFDAAQFERSSEFQVEQGALQSAADAARQTLEAHAQKRQARIALAFKNCRKRALDRIDREEDRHKYLFQKRTLDAERQREADLAGAAARLEQFKKDLAVSQQHFAMLDGSVAEAMSGVGEFEELLSRSWPLAVSSGDESQLLAELEQLGLSTEAAIRRLKRRLLLGLFRVFPLWLWLVLIVIGYAVASFALPYFGIAAVPQKPAAVWSGAALAAIFLAYLAARQFNRPTATSVAQALAKARQWHTDAWQKAEVRERRDREQIHRMWEETTGRLDAEWQQAQGVARDERTRRPQQLESKRDRALATSARRHAVAVQQLEQRTRANLTRIDGAFTAREQQAGSAHKTALGVFQTELAKERNGLQDAWRKGIDPLYAEVTAINDSAARLFPAWDDPSWKSWAPAQAFTAAVPFGQVQVDLEALSGVRFVQSPLKLPGPARFNLPLALQFPTDGSLLIETGVTGLAEATAALNSVLFRLLALSPPGKLSLTILDPIGLGQSFAGLMHLADYEESQINSRIWTQASQIEERLAELSEHMEKVIQMYLRNEYPTIAEYNAHAGSLAEKYHFLVVAGFPVNFSEAAGKRLLNIAASGARCGVYTLIVWDQRRELPHDFVADDLRNHTVRLTASKTGFLLNDRAIPGTELRLDSPPPPEFVSDFLHKVGESTRDSTRVELPFSAIIPANGQRWTAASGEEFRVPIGRSGATKLQYLALGKGTRQHVLIAGKTGSGKSTLFHVLITNTALHYSPAEVEFYLVDFKKGVEFKCYASRRLPHARVVAIESDREFGLSVLQRVDDELRRRGDLFRKAGVQDLPSFRRAEPTTALPRLLLVIDEFQEFFTEEDRISQSAAVLLDRIVRQGRAFGMHVLLGSQTLGGAYTLARATIGQMVVRIALQCNEADAYLIMDENNAAPRLLSRPGEGIYNDMAGAREGNSPFQVAWLSDDARDRHLSEVRAQADQAPTVYPPPMVFEGNAPADIKENHALLRILAERPKGVPPFARAWLGAPNAIKGPTEVAFLRQAAANLLVVGQTEEALFGLPGLVLLTLAAQYPAGSVRLVLIENTAPGSAERALVDRALASMPQPVQRPKRHELPALLDELNQQVMHRTGEELTDAAAVTFLVVMNLAEQRLLRQEDEFSLSTEGGTSPAAAFLNLVTDGPSKGCHVIASVDTYANVSRCLGRKALSQFHWRVLFQMSASDSASLMDSAEASQLGYYRALLFNEREGYIEKFRPYAVDLSSAPSP